MTGISYLDFDLLFEASDTGWRARVLNSPAGQATVDFSSPFSQLELENFYLRVGRPRQSVRHLGSPEMQLAQQYGARLFEAVFEDEMYGCFRSSLTSAQKEGKGLRVRLRMDAPGIGDLPWEYLYDSRSARFLSLSTDTPIVRYLETAESIRPLAVELPLKVVLMISDPSGYSLPLNPEQECERVMSVLEPLARQRHVTVERLESATLGALQHRLRHDECHILHFVGHGRFDEREQDGKLLLENEDGSGRPLSGHYLGTLLHNHRPLRLVVLNACEGARTGHSDPFAGVAQGLVQQGIPAVIAMQCEITHTAAVTFSGEFYAAIADGYPVDAALAEARTAIFAQGNDIEWGTPALYMRTPDGRIFDLAQASTRAPPATREPPLDDKELEYRLAQLYTDGLGAFWLEDWDRAARYFQAVVDVRPNYQDAPAKLKACQQQKKLHELYDQAQLALNAARWQEAISLLEAVVSERRDFPDAEAQLQEARKSAQLADLHAEALRLHRAQQWQAVVNIFAQIAALDPEYADPEELLARAEREVLKAEQEAELNDLYGRALQEMDARHWREARRLLEQVKKIAPQYRETEQLLDRVTGELARERAERWRQGRLYVWYKQLIAHRRWMWIAGGMLGIFVVGALTVGTLGLWPGAKSPPESQTTPSISPTRVSTEIQGIVSASPMATTKTPLPSGKPVATPTATDLSTEPPTPSAIPTSATRVAQRTATATATPSLTPTVTTTSRPTSTATTAPSPTPLPTSSPTVPTFTATPQPPTETPTATLVPPTPTSALSVGATRVREKDGAVMVYVPAGEFWMGSTDQDVQAVTAACVKDCEPNRYPRERPQHKVYLNAFWIDRTEVTNARYKLCVANGACSPPSKVGSNVRGSYYDNPQFDNYPVVNVTWRQAREYARWAGGRLPTEAEWEYAARGPNRNIYPWGNRAPDNSLLNYGWNLTDTTAVGSYPAGASWCGALDMAGNVWEWTSSLPWAYPYNPNDGRENPDTGGNRVFRGGAFAYYKERARCAYRGDDLPGEPWDTLGIRAVVSHIP